MTPFGRRASTARCCSRDRAGVGAGARIACESDEQQEPVARLTDGSIGDRAAVSPAVARLLLPDKGQPRAPGGYAARAGMVRP
jgi:hypothetical protein